MPEFTDETQKKIFEFISNRPVTNDDIISELGLKASEVSSNLTLMELSGWVTNLGGNQWVKM